MNKVVLIGRLGGAPETTTLQSGKTVTKFSLATTEYFGKDSKETNWHNITIWGEYGETMAKYLNTGSQISVDGRIQYSTNEKDGVKRIYTSIVCDKIELLDPKNSETTNSSSSSESAQQPKKKEENKATTTKKEVEPADDDLPF